MADIDKPKNTPDERAKIVGGIQKSLKDLKDAIGLPKPEKTESKDEVTEGQESNESNEQAIITAAGNLAEAFKTARDKLGTDDKAFKAIDSALSTNVKNVDGAEAMLHALIDSSSSKDLAALAGSLEASDLVDEEQVMQRYIENLTASPLDKVQRKIEDVLLGKKGSALREKLEKLKIKPELIVRLLMSAILSFAENFSLFGMNIADLGPEQTKMLSDQRFKQEVASLDAESKKAFEKDPVAKAKHEKQWRTAYSKWLSLKDKDKVTRPSLLAIINPSAAPEKPVVVENKDKPVIHSITKINNHTIEVDKQNLIIKHNRLEFAGKKFDTDDNTSITSISQFRDAGKSIVTFTVGNSVKTIAVAALTKAISESSSDEITLENQVKLKKRKDDSSSSTT